MTRLAHWNLYTLAENYPEYMDRYSITMERLKMAIPWTVNIGLRNDLATILLYLKGKFLFLFLFVNGSIKRIDYKAEF